MRARLFTVYRVAVLFLLILAGWRLPYPYTGGR